MHVQVGQLTLGVEWYILAFVVFQEDEIHSFHLILPLGFFGRILDQCSGAIGISLARERLVVNKRLSDGNGK